MIHQIGHAYWDKDKQLFVGVFINRSGICPYTILESPRSRNYAGFYAIRQDLMEANEAIQYLIDHPDAEPILKRNVLFAAIVQYAKSYTGSKGRWAQINSSQVFQNHPPEIEQFHNSTMNLRNEYLAHAGQSPHEFRVMLAVLNPDINNKKIEAILYNSLRLMNDDTNLQIYNKMIEIAIGYVENKMQSIKEAHDVEINGLGIETIYALSKTPEESGFAILPNYP